MTRIRQFATDHRGAVGFLGGALSVVVIAGGGLALAAIPSSTTGAFTGCVNKTSGAVRVIDYQAGKRCTTRERTISWSKGYRYRGAWSSATAYAVLDVVSYNGSSYLAKTSSKAKTPSSASSSWGLLAAAGATGPQGIQGAQGAQGVQGPQGVQGAQGVQGPAGDAPFKTVNYSYATMPAGTGTVVNWHSLTFTAPAAGFAHVTAAGYCILHGPSISVAIFASTGPTTPNFTAGGVVQSPSVVPSTEDYAGSWATDTTFAVTAGSHTAYLDFERDLSGTGALSCAGQLHVDFLTQQMP